MFDPPVNLKKNTKYQIEAFISGPTSAWGAGDFSTVQCDGVTFIFSDCISGSANRTCPHEGQFSEFLFGVGVYFVMSADLIIEVKIDIRDRQYKIPEACQGF